MLGDILLNIRSLSVLLDGTKESIEVLFNAIVYLHRLAVEYNNNQLISHLSIVASTEEYLLQESSPTIQGPFLRVLIPHYGG